MDISRHRVSNIEFHKKHNNRIFISPYDLEVTIVNKNNVQFGNSLTKVDDSILPNTIESHTYINISRKLANIKNSSKDFDIKNKNYIIKENISDFKNIVETNLKTIKYIAIKDLKQDDNNEEKWNQIEKENIIKNWV
tara:strand:+ start:1002 stop:1412 length:411 start_codon:yes stop_codon:yes gene_type:complete